MSYLHGKGSVFDHMIIKKLTVDERYDSKSCTVVPWILARGNEMVFDAFTDMHEHTDVPLPKVKKYLPALEVVDRKEQLYIRASHMLNEYSTRDKYIVQIKGGQKEFDRWVGENFVDGLDIVKLSGINMNMWLEPLPILQFGALYLGAVAAHGKDREHLNPDFVQLFYAMSGNSTNQHYLRHLLEI